MDLRPHHPLISQVPVPPLAIDEVSSLLAGDDDASIVVSLRLVCEQTTACFPARPPAMASVIDPTSRHATPA